ncbi:MAG: phosphate signaling complex protein PhoU [Christensenellales bacterium]
MTTRIDRQFGLLNTELLAMGALAESAIQLAADALVSQDTQKAEQAISFSLLARQKERDIESMCLRLLLRQHPVAKDLRMVSAALKMITDMERICDQAADISEIIMYLAKQTYIKTLEHLPQMAQAAKKMVHTALDAFIRQDAALAQSVVKMDDTVDDLFTIIKNELIDLIQKDTANGEQAIDLLMIAKYLERIGDHAQNIAEWVEFAITGVHQRENGE